MRTLFLCFALAFSQATAQTASNFTIDDIDGNTRDLFNELDNGNIVVLKFFTSWCTICNNTADEVVDIYNTYRTNGDPVVFWALDRDPNETNADAAAYRDQHNIPFPVIGEAYAVAQQFGVVYQPEYYIVRPDRSYEKKTNYSAMQTAVNDALVTLNTGIEALQGTQGVLIAADRFRWEAPAIEHGVLQVFDRSGRVMLDRRINGQENVTLDLPSGIYVYHLTAPDSRPVIGRFGIVQ